MVIAGANSPTAALLCSPGMGHLIPIIELGKHLRSHHFSDVTIFVVSTDFSTTHSQIIQQSSNFLQPCLLNIVILPPVNISGQLGPDSPIGARISLAMEKSLPLLRSAILSMERRPTALIVDMFSTNALAIARDLGMLNFVFVTSTAWLLAVTVYTPAIDEEALDRHLKHREPLRIPGCKPVRFEDTLEPLLLRGQPVFEQFVQMGVDISRADGILVNTWEDLEPVTLQALRDSENGLGGMIQGTIYPVGPIVRTIEPGRSRNNEVLNWLDRQPPESVLYVSFGSGGTLSPAQMAEVAWGLELSEQRFVWVVRSAKENATNGAFFNVENAGGDDFLPEGFTCRTEKVGLVVPKWAQQAEILAHRSVGGFMTHCGWNSTVEGIVTGGVPMIAWPLYAEQMMNATMLTEELGVALRVKKMEKESSVVIDRLEIQKLIGRLMVEEEGRCMRARVEELKHSAEMAVSEAGSSFKSLNKLANCCEVHQKTKVSIV
ncbi:anthocyanidin 3-O-glucosyltransferase 5-like [Neltuma alba]|uniref:anthocyanidin 3-O-glucosyltransferase 5-like n=1 Tax=Neltuma alba TaxID=207710 RepID=UPI0010A4AA9D|nr:anthocyanidin 3-O-glucosyltransferase 5-like [Prosopis alba]